MAACRQYYTILCLIKSVLQTHTKLCVNSHVHAYVTCIFALYALARAAFAAFRLQLLSSHRAHRHLH